MPDSGLGRRASSYCCPGKRKLVPGGSTHQQHGERHGHCGHAVAQHQEERVGEGLAAKAALHDLLLQAGRAGLRKQSGRAEGGRLSGGGQDEPPPGSQRADRAASGAPMHSWGEQSEAQACGAATTRGP